MALLRAGGRLIVVVVGDATEGLHHETTQIITARVDTQEAMAAAVIDEGLHLAHWSLLSGDVMRWVTGTKDHDGNGAASLERIARQVMDVEAAALPDGRVTCDGLSFSVNGVPFVAAHKPGSGPGSREQTRGNAYQGWLKSLYLGCLEAGHQPPRFVMTAHHHQFMERHVYSSTGEVVMTGVMLPAWKVKDEHVYNVAPFALGSVGMYAVEVEADGTTRTHDWRIPVVQDRCEEL